MNRRARLAALAVFAVVDLGISSTSASSDHNDHGNPPAATATHGTPAKPASPTKGVTNTTPAAGSTKYVPAASQTNAAPAADEEAAPNADQVIKLLQEGNERWARNSNTNPHTDLARREQVTTDGQKPMATIFTCADSRLPVERMFDRGVGELFVVRVAGNVIGAELTGTIEYGLGHLHTPVLVVMGHSKCGAVAAAASGAEVHGSVRNIVNDIMPAVERARRQNPSADKDALVAAAVRENVWQSVYDLFKNSEEIRSMAQKGEVRVIGAVADIATGKVEFLGEHPWQAELISALDNAAAALEPTAHAEVPAVPEHAPASGGH